MAVRERYIFSMKSEQIDSNHWNLFLKTQAGTYPNALTSAFLVNINLLGRLSKEVRHVTFRIALVYNDTV